MARWAEFEQAAPELAAIGRDCVERYGFMLLGTVRRDGTARISPVGVRLVNDELAMSFIARSTKEQDVRRDPRVLLHSPVLHADDPNSEFKLRGRAFEIDDERLARKAAMWHPPPPLVAFRVEVEHAAYLAWSKGEVTVTRWSAQRGLH
jgi:Pyridoxamine 5'-phosphate oxidase